MKIVSEWLESRLASNFRVMMIRAITYIKVLAHEQSIYDVDYEIHEMTHSSSSSRANIPSLENNNTLNPTGNQLLRCKSSSDARANNYNRSAFRQISCRSVVDERIWVGRLPEGTRWIRDRESWKVAGRRLYGV